jgi:hypothetical protein
MELRKDDLSEIHSILPNSSTIDASIKLTKIESTIDNRRRHPS